MGRAPCCDKASGLKKGPWTPEEDAKLINYISNHGPGNWRNLPNNAGLERCGKSCRLRWTNYLRPDIKRGRFSFEEEETIIQLHSVLGNKWSAIAAKLPGRTDNEIKNYWNTNIRKRLLRMGIDPVTHTPRLDLYDLSASSLILNSNSLCNLNLSSMLSNQAPLLANPQLLNLLTTLLSSLNPQMLLHKYFQENDQHLIINALLQNYQVPPPLLDDQFQTSKNQERHCMEILKQLLQNTSVQGLANSNYMTNLSCPMSSQENTPISSNIPNVDDINPENSYLLMQDPLVDGCFNFQSVMSTPLSSPTPSNINSNGNFEFPESFDISEFL